MGVLLVCVSVRIGCRAPGRPEERIDPQDLQTVVTYSMSAGNRKSPVSPEEQGVLLATGGSLHGGATQSIIY